MHTTILITGGTGYIGSWVVKYLLEEGKTVRVALRSLANREKYKHLMEIAEKSAGTLEFHEADLLKEGSFDNAAKGCDAVIHMASPFKLSIKNPEKELIEPALAGTANVLSAVNKAGTVQKVVLTSSVAAIYGDAADMKRKGLSEFTEQIFNDSSSIKNQPYSFSKVLAEKKAWEIHDAQNRWDMAVINPSFVMGPPLTPHSESESITFMRTILSGAYRSGAPDLNFGFVDVRDVARAHIAALHNQEAQGRFILSNTSLSILELTALIRKHSGNSYKLPKRRIPKVLMYAIGWMFGLTPHFIKNNVGIPLDFNNFRSRQILAIQYTPFESTVVDMIAALENIK